MDLIPPSYSETLKEIMDSKLTEIIRKYEINQEYAHKLHVLKKFKIVFILDDSGSMNTKLIDSPLNKKDNLIQAKRWDELKYFTNIIIELAAIFNSNGCDVYFLNRNSVLNVTDKSQLFFSFNDKPEGYTPLEERFQEVLRNNSNLDEKIKLLVIIVTDGEPTDRSGKVNIKQFKDCLLNRPINVYTTIAVCTDDDYSVEYLNNWDKEMPRLGKFFSKLIINNLNIYLLYFCYKMIRCC